MRIGLNLLYLLPGVVGGTETYAAGLLGGLADLQTQDQFVVFVNQESAEWPLPTVPNFLRVVCPLKATSRRQRYLFEQTRLPALAHSHRLDLLHSLGYVTPGLLPCKSIVSILDILHDYPGSFARRQLLRLMVSLSAHRSSHILTISTNSQKELVSRLRLDPRKITVTYLAAKTRSVTTGVRWVEIQKRLGLGDEYLLAFSSLSPSKNIPSLLRALVMLHEETSATPKLVLVGHTPRSGLPLRDLVQSLGLSEQVVFTGYLPDSEVILLLRHATAFVFPSIYEGFGIPVLEAMAEGVPVACSNAASLPEVAGSAALLFDPRKPLEIAASIQALVNSPDLRAELISRGFQNLPRFSWRVTAEQTLAAYRMTVGTS
jgi:glycosyltransferase involved in cell wall biosynthesis